MNILLVIGSLDRGGAERIISMLADHWAEEGHCVSLVTLAGKHEDEYQLSMKVERIALNAEMVPGNPIHGIINNVWRILRLRKIAKRKSPDIMMSFVVHTNLLSLMSMLRTRVPVIVSERTNPAKLQIGLTREILRKMLYPRAAAVVVQTAAVKHVMQAYLPEEDVYVIPNPVLVKDPDNQQNFVSIRSSAKIPTEAKIVSAMGRLDPGKGFDLLIRSFQQVHARYPDWHLVIFGEGQERRNLEKLIAVQGMETHVHLPGSVRTPRRSLSESDIFVLSSRFEGFPNVLLEAMACGLPVISFNCPSGPSDIIRDGVDGLLVPCEDVNKLADALTNLMSNTDDRKKLGSNAREVTRKFSVMQIMDLWDQLAESVQHQNVSGYKGQN